MHLAKEWLRKRFHPLGGYFPLHLFVADSSGKSVVSPEMVEGCPLVSSALFPKLQSLSLGYSLFLSMKEKPPLAVSPDVLRNWGPFESMFPHVW